MTAKTLFTMIKSSGSQVLMTVVLLTPGPHCSCCAMAYPGKLKSPTSNANALGSSSSSG
jgi:hypothetical protein